MDTLERIFKWILRYFFFISIIVFIIVYLFWFRLTPFTIPDVALFDGQPIINLKMGLRALQSYTVFGAFFLLAQKRSCLRSLFLIPTILFFGLSFLTVTSCFPSVVDTAKFDGVTYYLTYNHICILDTQYGENYLTVSKGWPNYELFALDDKHGDKIVYDKTTKTVGVVEVNYYETERLVFIVDDHPRSYEWNEQYGDHLYYVSHECISWIQKYYGYICDTNKYTIYQYKTDNTSCAPLPMQYTGREITWSYIENNETTNELDFYVVRYEGSYIDTLVYSYGSNPRCYVEGCEILSLP